MEGISIASGTKLFSCNRVNSIRQYEYLQTQNLIIRLSLHTTYVLASLIFNFSATLNFPLCALMEAELNFTFSFHIRF